MRIAKKAARIGLRLVFLSSVCVFSGAMAATRMAAECLSAFAQDEAAASSGAENAKGDGLIAWEGKRVLRVEFQGVAVRRFEPLPRELAQQPGAPLKASNVRASLRRLYATGLYDTIAADGSLEDGGVVLIFRGQPRVFIGVVSVTGARGANTNSLLVRTSRLAPGTRFTASGLDQAETAMRKSLAENGYYQPSFTHKLTPHPQEQLVDIAFTVNSGPHARIGGVGVSGESGLTPEEFRHYSKLKPGHSVDQDTTSKALNGLENHYRKTQRLEADVKLRSQEYVSTKKDVDYQFAANRGPVVHVLVDGVGLSDAKIRRLLPIYEEGSVDEDLLNEGNRRLQNYYQRLGYFDVKVRHEQKAATPELVEIVFHVQLGARHRVGAVKITGAKYFDLPTLQERLSVRARDAFDRQGVYNQSLVEADVNSLQAIYQNNGFSHVKVTSEIQDEDKRGSNPMRGKQVYLAVVYHVDEGEQQRVHSVQLEGTDRIAVKQLTPLLNTTAGQPFSPESLANDREALLTYYLSRGFDQVQVEVTQSEASKPETEDQHSDKKAAESGDSESNDSQNEDSQSKDSQRDDSGNGRREKSDAAKANAAKAATVSSQGQVDIAFHIREGEQVFLRRVLITGLHYTRRKTIERGITLKEGEPLDESALLDTQRNLYDLALFNEVNPVIQNPTGEEPRKTVLLQTTEARRWDVTYGGGLEAQTGTVNGGGEFRARTARLAPARVES